MTGAFDAFADRVQRELGDRPAVALAGVATELAATLTGAGREVATNRLARAAPRLFADVSVPSRDIAPLAPPDELASPDLLGCLHEQFIAVDGNARRARGAVYTPPSVAAGLVAEALHGASFAHRTTGFTVCDPSVGGGAFLLAAARVLRAKGLPADRIVRDLLWGIDVDPLAIAVAEASLALWAMAEGACAAPGSHLAVGDAIAAGSLVWSGIAPTGGFDLVAGNPPFQNQLERMTARSQPRAAQLRRRMGAVAAGYADTAVVFLTAACDLARIGGRVVLVQPLSMLGARDAAPARDAVAAQASLVALWVAPASVFGAAVRTCAPVLEVRERSRDISHTAPSTPVERGGQSHGPVQHNRLRRTKGAAVELFDAIELEPDDLTSQPSWAHLALGPLGIPEVEPPHRDGGRIGDLATATAGFRDEYYGLAPFVVDHGEVGRNGVRPLITSGLIDPLWCRWGQIAARFNGRRIGRPSVDVAALANSGPSALARWIDDRLEPKLLVATQTRVIEAIVDEAGSLVPSVPVVALHAPPQQLWRLATVLHAPPVSAWAFARAAGAAMSADAIKLAARQLLDVPLPIDDQRWHEATALLQTASSAAHARDVGRWRDALRDFAPVASAAYGVADDDPSVLWWLDRLPNPARGRREVPRPA